MVNPIATSLGGMQKAAQQAEKAATAIAASASMPVDVVDISEAALGQASLEQSVVALKTAALMYKANAQALSIMLETQKDAFEQLI